MNAIKLRPSTALVGERSQRMSLAKRSCQFKVFSGPLSPENTLGELADKVSHFVKSHKVTPMSMGIEYIQAGKLLILTLGYARGHAHFAIELQAMPLGKCENLTLAGNDFSLLEQAMAEAIAKVDNIICHELYITEDNEFIMIFMTRQ